MKLYTLIIVFVIITSLPILYAEYKYSYALETTELNHKYEANLTAAAQDSIQILRTNALPALQNSYESYNINPINPQPAFERFLNTLAINYGIEDEISKEMLSRYIPAFAIVDYDGLLLSVFKEYTDARGDKVFDRVWLPKITFTYSDTENNIINFTIDKNVEVYDAELGEWFIGKRDELALDKEITIPILNDIEHFDDVRRKTIVNTIQEQLAYYINEHNVYSKYLDSTYTFVLPTIDKEEWLNTVDDISILAFFQGYPSKFSDFTYNKHAFVGARLNFTDRIYAGTINGRKRFWGESCDFPYQAEEIYSNKRDAAANGYVELSCLN
ncbi:MAG: hypothetical protein KBT36_11815 [Kurthia sp.]|nr:hypothetical protein [Candidatus Kurthia equi]